eukprot:GDKI01009473.1.p1 GENE.GDKI01009473.1~~GDKI01009473.1.p1  ORF type:complete len:513 (+),score=102.54 GDKI01009473.1:24-1541(+)
MATTLSRVVLVRGPAVCSSGVKSRSSFSCLLFRRAQSSAAASSSEQASNHVVNKGDESTEGVDVAELISTGTSPRQQLLGKLNRYDGLRKEDRERLLGEHLRGVPSSIPDWQGFREGMDIDAALRESKRLVRERQAERKRLQKIRDSTKPSYMIKRQVKVKTKIASDEVGDPEVVTDNFTPAAAQLSLVEDRHKAEIYEQIVRKIQRKWKPSDQKSDRVFDVMANAVREDLIDQARPTLVNEFADYDNPYMMKRAALRRLLHDKCVRNALDESMVEPYLDRRPDLIKLRQQAKMPPEVLEPLVAFRGDVNYNFDARTRLGQKLDAVDSALAAVNGGDASSVLQSLPENQRSDEIHKAHPFMNHFGFETAVPQGWTGGIKANRPIKKIDEEMQQLRYPTLQRVAHTLPKDPKYKSNVIHTIRLLERSRGWDFESKVRAVNTLKEVHENMARSHVYNRILNTQLPMKRGPGLVKYTKKRSDVYCRGLKYIRSLTTQKPLHLRKTKGK